MAAYRTGNHQMPRKCCILRLTPMIPHQQQNPSKIGLPPVLISFTMFVFNPTALIATTIRNLLSVLNGVKKPDGTPRYTQTVVMTDASTKYKMKKGKICFREIVFPLCFAFLACHKDSTSVIGIIARVRVSFTVTALSKVCEPR